jgi:transglutaminase-like putative cysteine protease
MQSLQLRVGADFRMTSPQDTPAVFVIRPEARAPQWTLDEYWHTTPFVPYRDYTDLYGNVCRRMTLPAGTCSIAYDALVQTTGELDPVTPNARECPVAELPDDALVYTLPSRYCLSDVIFPRAQELFGAVPPGWSRVAAICDWVNANVSFAYGSSNAATTAADVLASGSGVCRDFAHLAITFCRALNIPARYAFGYLPDIDVPPPYAAMDFAAWFEAYLDGSWWLFDPRNNERRRGRVTIARGRDALDVAMVTTFGFSNLDSMTVRADRAEDDVRSLVR